MRGRWLCEVDRLCEAADFARQTALRAGRLCEAAGFTRQLALRGGRALRGGGLCKADGEQDGLSDAEACAVRRRGFRTRARCEGAPSGRARCRGVHGAETCVVRRRALRMPRCAGGVRAEKACRRAAQACVRPRLRVCQRALRWACAAARVRPRACVFLDGWMRTELNK